MGLARCWVSGNAIRYIRRGTDNTLTYSCSYAGHTKRSLQLISGPSVVCLRNRCCVHRVSFNWSNELFSLHSKCLWPTQKKTIVLLAQVQGARECSALPALDRICRRTESNRLPTLVKLRSGCATVRPLTCPSYRHLPNGASDVT